MSDPMFTVFSVQTSSLLRTLMHDVLGKLRPKGIPKNLSSQVLGEVCVNFLGWIPTKTLPIVKRRSKFFRTCLGRLRMSLCYWKAFPVPKTNAKRFWRPCNREAVEKARRSCCTPSTKGGAECFSQRIRVHPWLSTSQSRFNLYEG